MKKYNIAVGVVVAVALLLSVLAITNKPTSVIETIREIGGMPGNEISLPSIVVNGVETFYSTASFKTATGTLCAIKSPASTSTLVSFTAQNTSATSTAVILVMEKGTTAYASTATSTNTFSSMLLAANSDAPFMWIASSTATGVYGNLTENGNVFSPSQYLVYHAKNGAGGTIPYGTTIGTVFSGECNAVWREL